MFTEANIKQYVLSIDWEISKLGRDIINYYSYGYGIPATSLRDLQIHIGYKKTLLRYIEDNDTLTDEEVLCILRLYKIEQLDIPELEFPEVLDLIFIPKPSISLNIDDILEIIKLTFIPKPVIELQLGLQYVFVPKPTITIDLDSIPINLVFVPRPTIAIDLETIPVNLVFVPKPTIIIDLETMPISLDFVPKPTIEFDLSTIPPAVPDLEFVPMPVVHSGILDTTIINYVPKPTIEFDIDTVVAGKFYYGYSSPSETTQAGFLNKILTLSSLNQMISGGYDSTVGRLISKDISAGSNTDSLEASGWNYPGPDLNQTYMAFLIPLNIEERTKVLNPSGHSFNVGPRNADMFELRTETVEIDGVTYGVYVSRNFTIIDSGVWRLNK